MLWTFWGSLQTYGDLFEDPCKNVTIFSRILWASSQECDDSFKNVMILLRILASMWWSVQGPWCDDCCEDPHKNLMIVSRILARMWWLFQGSLQECDDPFEDPCKNVMFWGSSQECNDVFKDPHWNLSCPFIFCTPVKRSLHKKC
jgi:hypothetical protein